MARGDWEADAAAYLEHSFEVGEYTYIDHLMGKFELSESEAIEQASREGWMPPIVPEREPPVRITGYLYLSESGGLRSTVRPGNVKADEVRVRIDVEVPSGYFRRPDPSVTVTLPGPPEVSSIAVHPGPVEVPENSEEGRREG